MVKRPDYLVKFSKGLRKKSTAWEQKLWKYLRAGRFYGLKFKRQVAIENSIVDFCCNQKKLIIELDGYSHKYNLNDKDRDKFFIGLGYIVLRFWDDEIDKNLESVLEKIKRAAKV